MNIFFLDWNPTKAARLQCDKHVVKMIVESAQILCTVRRQSGDHREDFYKITHANHPCTKWVAASDDNYAWLYAHFEALCAEYTHRYGKVHKTWEKFGYVLRSPKMDEPYARAVLNGAFFDITAPALAMPDEFKTSDAVESYRAYYRSKKDKMQMRWTKSREPEWMS